jgi:hypothetical protein
MGSVTMPPSTPYATRTHLSRTTDPIVLREVGQEERRDSYKPAGFWYEVDGDWRRWCEDEDFGLDGQRYLFRVDLGECNVLKVDTLGALDGFHNRFIRREPAWFERIDWAAVAAQYDGVEIAPYQWTRRLQGSPGTTAGTALPGSSGVHATRP